MSIIVLLAGHQYRIDIYMVVNDLKHQPSLTRMCQATGLLDEEVWKLCLPLHIMILHILSYKSGLIVPISQQ